MKTVRPMNNILKPKEEKLTLFIDGHEVTPFTKEQVEQSFTYNPNKELIDDNTNKDQKLFIYTKDESNIDIAKQTEDAYKNFCKDQTIENLMDEVIKQKNDKIQVTISLTKRQYDLYVKKGGESWVKKAIIGQRNRVKRKKNK